MQTWALIVDCFREAIDRKLFWVMIGISVVIAAGMACVGFDDQGVSFLFGTWRHDSADFAAGSELGRALVGSILTRYIADVYIGWIVIVMALVATAGIFPSLMERGTVDVVLAKPMSRVKIFLGKYVGSMVFVAVQAAVFVILTLLVVGLRWRCWFWGYLWSIPLIVALFSYVYVFSVLFAVATRSAMTSLLLSLVAWVVIWVPQVTYGALVTLSAAGGDNGAGDAPFTIDDKWVRAASAVRWVVPKTQDIPLIAGNLIGASTVAEVLMGTEAAAAPGAQPARLGAQIEAEKKLGQVSAAKSIGSSLLFEAVILLAALWRFCRQDF